MTRFAIAGIQMRVSATEDNVATMRHRLATLMAIYPWVRMVVFSELAVSGPLPQAAQPIPGPAEEALQAMAANHDLWLVSGYHDEGRNAQEPLRSDVSRARVVPVHCTIPNL